MGRSHGGSSQRRSTYPRSSGSVRRDGPAGSGSWGGSGASRGGSRETARQRPESGRSREDQRPRADDSGTKGEDLKARRGEEGKTREDRQERRDEEKGPIEEKLDERQEERRDYREQQQQERRAIAGGIHEERQEFFEHYSYPYWGYGYPYSGTRVFISINNYDSYECAKSTVVVDGKTYYRCDDGWYDRVSRDGEVQYVAVPPPEGTEVEQLTDPEVVRAGGETYHLSNGVYYKKLTREGKTTYVVVDPPVGLEVDALPKEAIEQTIEGKTYYQYGKVFYRPVGDGNSYIIVPAPY
jgi:hypothetical protein